MCCVAGTVDPASLPRITDDEMLVLGEDFLKGAWDPHKVDAPLNAKYHLRERLPALTFAQRKLIADRRDTLDWKVH